MHENHLTTLLIVAPLALLQVCLIISGVRNRRRIKDLETYTLALHDTAVQANANLRMACKSNTEAIKLLNTDITATREVLKRRYTTTPTTNT